ncbi:MAG: ABC transporter ATP-binding protein [Lachnospiraceae bacterium]|nr:ABC transporter ATP-binding protein [Lachnospiraceae bacterium]
MTNLLEVKNLSVSFHTAQGELQAVRDVSFSLRPGEVLAIVGESGCGKSVLCKAIMKLLSREAYIKGGSILVEGVDITNYGEREMERLRGKLFSMVFQDPMTSLNPTISIGKQIAEAVQIHHPKMTKSEVYDKVIELMKLVGIEEPEERYRLYPYHFSGGMRQRSVMAIALASNPRMLFADEPTTALDVTIQAQILDLLREIQKKLNTATILVTHDLGVVARVADRVAVMYAGKIVEIGTAREIFYDARHPYTWGLMRSLPAYAKEDQELYTIPGMPPTLVDPPRGDAFACRNEYALDIDYEEMPPMFKVSDTHYAATWLLHERAPEIKSPVEGMKLSVAGRNVSMAGRNVSGTEKIASIEVDTAKYERAESEEKSPVMSETAGALEVESAEPSASHDDILLDVQHLTHQFKLSKSAVVRAVDDVSFQIRKGEIFGLVGESGSGKSTVARCVMNVYRPQGGRILFNGIDVCDRKQFKENQKLLQTARQIIFQNSTSSLNQRMKIADIVTEPLEIHHMKTARGTLRNEAEFQLHYVGMDKSYLDKYPSELSGGMRQRVAIARALSMEPELLVADEPIASLDVSIQAQIINLLKHCNLEHGCSILFIAHDLSVVRYLCDRIGVMYRGKLVEVAPTKELFENPRHPYTKRLLSAIPVPDPELERSRVISEFDSAQVGQNGQDESGGSGQVELRLAGEPMSDVNGRMVEVCPGHLVMKGGHE